MEEVVFEPGEPFVDFLTGPDAAVDLAEVMRDPVLVFLEPPDPNECRSELRIGRAMAQVVARTVHARGYRVRITDTHLRNR